MQRAVDHAPSVVPTPLIRAAVRPWPGSAATRVITAGTGNHQLSMSSVAARAV